MHSPRSNLAAKRREDHTLCGLELTVDTGSWAPTGLSAKLKEQSPHRKTSNETGTAFRVTALWKLCFAGWGDSGRKFERPATHRGSAISLRPIKSCLIHFRFWKIRTDFSKLHQTWGIDRASRPAYIRTHLLYSSSLKTPPPWPLRRVVHPKIGDWLRPLAKRQSSLPQKDDDP